MQADAFNRSQLATVLLVPLTRSLEWARAPGNILRHPRHTGLEHASVANVSQLTVSDRRRLLERAGSLPNSALNLLDEGLRQVLGL